METRDERRRRRLEQLCNASGGVKAVAQKAGLGWEGLDQILKRTPLPEKKDGTRSQRALGDPAAEKIEDAFDLGRGWFDWPLDAVDYKRYWALDPVDRGYAQARMMSAIEERAPLPASHRSETLKRAQEAVKELSDEDRILLFSAISQPGVPDHEVERRIPATRARGLPSSIDLSKINPKTSAQTPTKTRKETSKKRTA